MTDKPKLNDLWTDSSGYKTQYQTEEDVETVLGLLRLEAATSMVDIGCGNGAFAIEAARRCPACKVHAYDALESAVERCRAESAGLPNLTAGVAWANAVPMEDASADRVLLRSVLHHIAEPSGVYREIARLLMPGGLLVLQSPCNYWEPEFAEVLNGFMVLMDPTHKRYYYQPSEIAEGLKAAGLSPGQPECWRYSFPFLNRKQAEYIREHHAEERLRLKPIGDGKWAVEGSWVRIVAMKPSRSS